MTAGEAVERGRAADAELASFGVTVGLAPVADVAVARRLVVGGRAVGDVSDLVADHPGAAVAGLRAGDVAAVATHVPRARRDRRRLPRRPAACPARPRRAGRRPLAGVMPAHLTVEAVDPYRPATPSPTVIGDVLRGGLGFDGAVVSDSLAMGALADRTPGDAPAEARHGEGAVGERTDSAWLGARFEDWGRLAVAGGGERAVMGNGWCLHLMAGSIRPTARARESVHGARGGWCGFSYPTPFRAVLFGDAAVERVALADGRRERHASEGRGAR